MNCIESFVNDYGGINNCLGKEREFLYNKFKEYCIKNKLEIITSHLFVRRLNLMYGTEVKLVTRNCKVTYIIVEKEN